MTRESLTAIGAAIAAHLATTEPDAILTDWFIAYGSMSTIEDADDGIQYGIHYTTSDTSPHGALGIATLGLGSLTNDLAPDAED